MCFFKLLIEYSVKINLKESLDNFVLFLIKTDSPIRRPGIYTDSQESTALGPSVSAVRFFIYLCRKQ